MTTAHFLSGLETLALVASSLSPTLCSESVQTETSSMGMIGVCEPAASLGCDLSLAVDHSLASSRDRAVSPPLVHLSDAETKDEAVGELPSRQTSLETTVPNASPWSFSPDLHDELPSFRRVTRRSLSRLASHPKPAPYSAQRPIRTRSDKNHPLPSPTAEIINQPVNISSNPSSNPSVVLAPGNNSTTEPSTPQPSSTPSSPTSTLDDDSFSSASPTLSTSARRSSLPPLKARANFPADSLKFLTRWLDANKKDPYPSANEKNVMVKESGLSLTQMEVFTPTDILFCVPDHPTDRDEADIDLTKSYEVEAILGQCWAKRDHKWYYWVKWEGYTNRWNEWVCEDNFNQDGDELNEYKRKVEARRLETRPPKRRLSSTSTPLTTTPVSEPSSMHPYLNREPSASSTSSYSRRATNHPISPEPATFSPPPPARKLMRLKRMTVSEKCLQDSLPVVFEHVDPDEQRRDVPAWSEEHLIPNHIATLTAWDTHIHAIASVDNRPDPTNPRNFKVKVVWNEGVLVEGAGRNGRRTYLPMGIVREKAKDRLIDYFFERIRFAKV
ncbi:hypothetical protein HDU98_007627 [Podochytrium sp. JEL0797]|nr:hypothetical protein HDU98_007627 [Podochytrium sp. JEL0797]